MRGSAQGRLCSEATGLVRPLPQVPRARRSHLPTAEELPRYAEFARSEPL
jgi:hypothetical protein